MGYLIKDTVDALFPRYSVTYSDRYLPYWYEPALFAASLGWLPQLYAVLSIFTPLEDQVALKVIFNSEPVYITMDKGNLRISNYLE